MGAPLPRQERDDDKVKKPPVRGAIRRMQGVRESPGSPMTVRRAAFIELHVCGPDRVRFNASRAAEVAGFAWPAKQGPRLMIVPEVVERVEALFFTRGIEPEGPEAVEIGRPVMASDACKKSWKK